MTRIRLRRGTEAQVLAVTDGADGEPYYSTDTEKLFIADETGVPQPLASGGARSQVTYTTASLAAGATETGTITVPKAYAIHKIETDHPARVRIYVSAAHRSADLSRSVAVDPTGDHGCVLEVVTTAAIPSLHLSPIAIGASPVDGTDAYIAVQNTDSVSRAVTVTIDVLSMEG